jgi:hypothetical protein
LSTRDTVPIPTLAFFATSRMVVGDISHILENNFGTGSVLRLAYIKCLVKNFFPN